MVDSICVFEDTAYRNLLPLVHLRITSDLRCGITTLREKIERTYPGIPLSLHCRGYLADLVREQNLGVPVNNVQGTSCLFVNGRLIADESLPKIVPTEGPDAMYISRESVVAARLSGTTLDAFRRNLPETIGSEHFEGLTRTEIQVALVHYPWDLVSRNGDAIVADFALLTAGRKEKMRGLVYEGAHLVNKENLYVGDGTQIKPGTVLDAESGPIYIGKNVTVFPNATIEGPAYVGDGCMIKIGAKIYENTSIGEKSKVGGEVEESIIHSHSNKQHDGFLGHSYLGRWVNLGADTNNSDLKNNYGNVSVVIDGESIDTGSPFVGLIMGDHSKSGINTMFNTGTVVGISSNVFGSGFPPKAIPSFAWGGAGGMTTYRIEKSLEVAKRVMARRKIILSAVEETVIREVFMETEKERESAGLEP
jgi:UDP-N-acetylglucosamine diphosphorylase/glucosamine-1-phosphate N-acetyltransferase